MSLHADALALLEAWAAPVPHQEALREQYVAHLRAHRDGVYRHAAPDHVTASAVVLDATGEHVLLTLHAKAGRWFQLGGHCEPGDTTLAGAALRESAEESGVPVRRLAVDPAPVQLSAHPVPFCRPPTLGPDDVVHHLDVRFLVVVDGAATPVVSEESLDVRWWPVDTLPDPEPDLVEAVAFARARLTGGAGAQSSAGSSGESSASSSNPSGSSGSSPGGGSNRPAAE
ncbi:NUDIX hydrolase [Nocardioides sp. CPCC 205120]|uniref:NUDIX hydrolase n=1 Tax=Nocardioides sp. CPCC 205120 TaxID=3406462 RepID=UPI003B5127B1